MEEHAHPHAHRPHASGFRWLDLSLALSAFFVSLSSLWLAIHNAKTMEKLVAANSYPNIDFDSGNMCDFRDGQGVRHAIYMSLQNTGIGPARLRSVEISFDGRPVSNLRVLLASCCTPEPAGSLPKTDYWSSGDQRGAMIQAGKSLDLFAWPRRLKIRAGCAWTRRASRSASVSAIARYSTNATCAPAIIGSRSRSRRVRFPRCPMPATDRAPEGDGSHVTCT